MCLTGNGDVTRREYGCASPGMHVLTGNEHTLCRVNISIHSENLHCCLLNRILDNSHEGGGTFTLGWAQSR